MTVNKTFTQYFPYRSVRRFLVTEMIPKVCGVAATAAAVTYISGKCIFGPIGHYLTHDSLGDDDSHSHLLSMGEAVVGVAVVGEVVVIGAFAAGALSLVGMCICGCYGCWKDGEEKEIKLIKEATTKRNV